MPNDTELDRFPQRKHPRLPRYDYTQQNVYFITICTQQKACIFGGPVFLSEYGHIADRAFSEINKHFPAVTVEKYVVMPNHVHALIRVEEAGTDVRVVVGQYKAYVTRQIRRQVPDLRVWQTSFHDHVIRTQQDYQRIWNYIEGNPAKWQEDCFFSE